MRNLTHEQECEADKLLDKGFCVELRPVKDGAEVLKVIRARVKPKQNTVPSP